MCMCNHLKVSDTLVFVAVFLIVLKISSYLYGYNLNVKDTLVFVTGIGIGNCRICCSSFGIGDMNITWVW